MSAGVPEPPSSLDRSAWTGAPGALLEAAVRRHGGWEAWRALGTVAVRMTALSGLVPVSKGLGRTFPAPGRIEVRPRDVAAVFEDYPRPGAQGRFTGGAVTLLDESGAVVEAITEPRARFTWPRKLRRWSPADALYFFGYAVTHYCALPFSLGEGRPIRMRRARYDGRALTGVEVELPASRHTHSRRQTFYFEEDGLLRRHDYVADIVGPFARGAHFWKDYVTLEGIEVPLERLVVARVGRIPTPIVALHARLAVVG